MAKTFGLMRLGRDAEIRFTPSGEPVANLSLVYNYGKAGDDGNRPSQWIDATLWGKRAEALAQYLMKGTVHGFTLSDAHIETYPKNDGTQGFKMSATVIDVELGPKGQSGGSTPAQQQRAANPAPAAQRPAANFSDMDDSDIPF